jgi:DNA-binding NarL/FixJ family response regulator
MAARPAVLESDVSLAQPLRVVIADLREAERGFVRGAVERPGLVVVAECADGASATAAVVCERAHICLIGAGLAGAEDAIAAIGSLPLAPKVVVLGSIADQNGFRAAFRAGAAGYVLREEGPARLADQLMDVAEGGVALARGLAALLVEGFPGRSHRPTSAPAGLTDRECEVLGLVAQSLATPEIARRLRISSTAVRRHMRAAMDRIASDIEGADLEEARRRKGT